MLVVVGLRALLSLWLQSLLLHACVHGVLTVRICVGPGMHVCVLRICELRAGLNEIGEVCLVLIKWNVIRWFLCMVDRTTRWRWTTIRSVLTSSNCRWVPPVTFMPSCLMVLCGHCRHLRTCQRPHHPPHPPHRLRQRLCRPKWISCENSWLAHKQNEMDLEVKEIISKSSWSLVIAPIQR
jgi:hypothetical protein